MSNAEEVLTGLLNFFDDELDGVPSAIVALGGAVVLTVMPDKTSKIDFLLKEDAVDADLLASLEEDVKAGGRVAIYICPDAPLPDDAENFPLTVLATGNPEKLKEALDEVKAHLRKTGGVDPKGGGGDD